MFSYDLARAILFTWDSILCSLHPDSDFVSFKFQLIRQTSSKDFPILKLLPTPPVSLHGLYYVFLCTNSKYVHLYNNSSHNLHVINNGRHLSSPLGPEFLEGSNHVFCFVLFV